MAKFNQAEFESKAKKMVAKYLGIDEKEVSMAWFRKVKSNEAVLCINVNPAPYYFDVLYLGERGRYIMTVYSYEDCTFYDDELLLNEKQKSCPYCHGFVDENKSLDISPNGKTRLGMSSSGYFEYTMNGLGAHVGEHYFNYCPMCGRDLRSGEK